MAFEFATAQKIVFGRGTARQIPEAARGMGSRALLVTGSDASRAGFVAESFPCTLFAVCDEPTVAVVQEGVDALRAAGCDVVIAIGGGSVLDAGKAIASMAANPGEVLDYIEVVGRGRPIGCASLPMIAAPTTAGTGTEVTRNAVLGSPEHGVKASLRSPLMLPRLAVVDPELTLGLPRAITASTGLDALTQVIEPYVSARRNALVDVFCEEGMRRVARSLRRAYEDGPDVDAREDMCFASLMGGLSLANAGLGIVHGFAAPVGGMFRAPHGAVCAALLPHGMRANIRALSDREPGGEALARYSRVAALLTGRADARPADGVEWVEGLCDALAIPGLRAYGVDEAYVLVLVEKAAQASSTKGNPIVLTAGEMTEMLESAL